MLKLAASPIDTEKKKIKSLFYDRYGELTKALEELRLISEDPDHSDFPNKSSHVYNYVDCYGAHGSGLATYETQSKTINKGIDNYKYEAINNIVNRLHLLYIPGLDKVTFVMNKIAGFTVKIQNVLKFLQDLEERNIPRSDVCFVFYGSKSEKRETKSKPYYITGDEFYKIAAEKGQCRVVSEMKLGTFARLFQTDNSRNKGATWINYAEINPNDLADEDEDIGLE
uniref:Uncharacterized protein n=1 Tax=Daphnia galeata TaxID=27404 RepID=A0A8J2RX47_9CRUS|nr:unnamed protein product [Daphnia galeata]